MLQEPLEGKQDGHTPQDNGRPQQDEKPILGPNALVGLPGETVEIIDPYTEAHPVAVLLNILGGFGNLIGRGPNFIVEKTPHYTNVNFCLVGPTTMGGKGQSWSTPSDIFEGIDPNWRKERVVSGLSSGEGLIYHVRDPNQESNGNIIDLGVKDKRLMVVEQEFSRTLKVMQRDTNPLSAVLREAWDGIPLHILNKNSPVRSTDPHISIIGHITPEELLARLTEVEMANGFANRFLWPYVERSKLIPSGKGVPADKLNLLIEKLKRACEFARTIKEMERDEKAEELWADVYPALSEGGSGLVGAITSRGRAQVLRFSMIYALLDCSVVIKVPHLKGSLALWDYNEESVKLIFGERLGDANVDLVYRVLKAIGLLTRTHIHNLLGRNARREEVDRVIAVLITLGTAEMREVKGVNVLYPKK